MYNNTAIMQSLLLSYFLTECEEELRFLETDYGFGYFSGMLEYAKGRQILKPCTTQISAEQSLDHALEIATIYDNGQTALEVTYKPSQSRLNIYVCYGRIHRLPLSDMISAAHREYISKTEHIFACDAVSLKRVLHENAASIRTYHTVITQPDEGLIERALKIRDKLLEQQIRAQFHADMEQAQIMAARAFVQKDYVRVIKLLTPYEHYLNAVSLRKMTQARQKLLGA